MKTLDKLDRKILFELDGNSRLTISALAKKLRQSRDKVDYRVERLIDNKIIRSFTTAVNLYQLGYCIFKTYLRLENDQKAIQDFIKYLKNHPKVYWIALCDGGWDMMVAVFAKSPLAYYETHNKILSEYNKIIIDYSMYTIVDMAVYRKCYFHQVTKEAMRVGGVPQHSKIDRLDHQILQKLSLDARTPYTEIADKLRTTPAIVKYRIEKMEQQKIIIGYPIEIDRARLNMLFFKAQFFLRDNQISLLNRFLRYCEDHPQITYCIEQLGDCTLEIETEVGDYGEYNQIIDEIRGEFSKFIRNFQSVLIKRSHFNWVPGEIDNG